MKTVKAWAIVAGEKLCRRAFSNYQVYPTRKLARGFAVGQKIVRVDIRALKPTRRKAK